MPKTLLLAAAVLALSACQPRETPLPELSGAELYTYHCSACHGPQGEGDGPVAEVMNVAVPNLRVLSQRNGGKFPAEAVASYIDGRNLPVAHGDRYMPIWGDIFSRPDAVAGTDDGSEPDEALVARRIKAITEFLERIQR
jgi:mono/diheme cytochrome c family protein